MILQSNWSFLMYTVLAVRRVMLTIVIEGKWESPKIRTVIQLLFGNTREQGSFRLVKRKWFSWSCRDKVLEEPFEPLSSNVRFLDSFEDRTFSSQQDMQRNSFSVIAQLNCLSACSAGWTFVVAIRNQSIERNSNHPSFNHPRENAVP